MRIARHRDLPLFLLLVLPVLFLSSPARAQDFHQPIRELARQVAAKTGAKAAISFSLQNLSSLSPAAVDEVRRQLEVEFRGAGLPLAGPQQATAEVSVTLSENWQGYLWIAEVRQGSVRDVIMLPAPRSAPASSGGETARLVLRKTELWSQEQAMLDAAVLSSGNVTRMLVLEPGRVALYVGRQLQQSAAIPRYQPWPRDLRGRLMVRSDHLFDVYLPGLRCSGADRDKLALDCRPADDPWPLGSASEDLSGFFGAARNFFTGALSGVPDGARTVAPFYTAAHVQVKSDVWLLAGVDGRVHYLDRTSDTPVSYKDWGSDIAGIKSDCDSGSQVLVAGAGDATRPDTVQAYEITGRDAALASAPVEFAGPVTALWTAADGASAIAVSRNLQTGKYEAFSLSIACGH